jgi:ABC-type bacteriocin/lantibiotic exporter with double-glycine peptidase domain
VSLLIDSAPWTSPSISPAVADGLRIGCGVLMLITLVVYDSTLTAIVVAVMAAAIGWFWFAAPVVRDLRGGD